MSLTLVQAEPESVPAVTAKLRRLGKATRAVETHLGRIGVWYPTRSEITTQLALLYEPRRPYGDGRGEFAQVSGRALTPDHQRIWVEVISEYLRAGEFDRRAGSIPVAQLARTLGCELRRDGHVPSKVDARIRRLVHDLTRAQFRGTLRLLRGDADIREFTLEQTLQLLDSPTWRPGPDGYAHLFFGIPMGLAQLVHDANQVTFLNAPTWDEIREEDELAALIWVMLECERIPPNGMTYAVFSGADGGIRDSSKALGIAELFRLGYKERKETVRRLRKALDCIVKRDDRYRGTYIARNHREIGMWNVRVMRAAHVPKAERNGLPHSIVTAWRAAYGGKRPSGNQSDILDEIVDRRGEQWILEMFKFFDGSDDPFGEIMAMDARLNKQRTREIRDSEHEAARSKQREEVAASASVKTMQLALNREMLLAQAKDSYAETGPDEKAEAPRGSYVSRVGDLFKAAGLAPLAEE